MLHFGFNDVFSFWVFQSGGFVFIVCIFFISELDPAYRNYKNSYQLNYNMALSNSYNKLKNNTISNTTYKGSLNNIPSQNSPPPPPPSINSDGSLIDKIDPKTYDQPSNNVDKVSKNHKPHKDTVNNDCNVIKWTSSPPQVDPLESLQDNPAKSLTLTERLKLEFGVESEGCHY